MDQRTLVERRPVRVTLNRTDHIEQPGVAFLGSLSLPSWLSDTPLLNRSDLLRHP